MKQAIDYLLDRNSMKTVAAPAPSDAELAQILQAAVSAPDHGGLTPWRFKIIRQESMQAFADFGIGLREASSEPQTPEKNLAVRAWLAEVPLIIAVGCHIDYSNTKIPESERMLATGAAMMNILNAAHMLGYGAFWSTGIATHIEDFQIGLGFDPLDYRFMGVLVIGTPKGEIPQKPRRPYTDFCEEWTQPLI